MERTHILYTCKGCKHQKQKLMKKKDSLRDENKMLGQGGNYRCSKCHVIKPINEYSKVCPTSERRRKACNVCRNKQMRERYYKRKEEKLMISKNLDE